MPSEQDQEGDRQRPLYIFLDEAGNFDFSLRGTKYFTITSVSLSRPFPFDAALMNLRFDLIETGQALEYFHASENVQEIRDQVFDIISSDLSLLRIDSVIIDR